jgi:type IX secretion system PorP/SprF family membrane protein
VNYKNQWKSVINPFKTIALAFDTKIYLNKKKKGNYFGLGASVFNDKVGVAKFTTNQLNIDLAYHLLINRHNSISAGVKTGFFERHIDPTGLKWDSQYNGKGYDASLPTRENMVLQSYGKFDLGVGLLYFYSNNAEGVKMQLGASMAHLTKPKNSFYLLKDPVLNYKYTGHFNLHYKIPDQNFVLNPAVIYVKQGGHNEIVAGSNFKFLLGQETRDKVNGVFICADA